MACIVLGVILASLFGTVTLFVAWRNGYPRLPRANFGQQ